MMLHPDDVAAEAERRAQIRGAQQIGGEIRRAEPGRADVLPAGELLQAYERLIAEHRHALLALGEARGQLQALPDLQSGMAERVALLERELEAARAALAEARAKPWWRRLWT